MTNCGKYNLLCDDEIVIVSFVIFNIAFWITYFNLNHEVIFNTNVVGEIYWGLYIILLFTLLAIYYLIKIIRKV